VARIVGFYKGLYIKGISGKDPIEVETEYTGQEYDIFQTD